MQGRAAQRTEALTRAGQTLSLHLCLSCRVGEPSKCPSPPRCHPRTPPSCPPRHGLPSHGTLSPAHLLPVSTEVMPPWGLCSPATSCATRPVRRSQKRSVPSKWPEATRAPSAVMARELQMEGHIIERRCRPSVRPHTCGGGRGRGGEGRRSGQEGMKAAVGHIASTHRPAPGATGFPRCACGQQTSGTGK